MASLRLSGSESVGRQPEGASKWFANWRAKRAFANNGFKVIKEYAPISHTISYTVYKNEVSSPSTLKLPTRVASYKKTTGGLEIVLVHEDAIAERIAYDFGAKVGKMY